MSARSSRLRNAPGPRESLGRAGITLVELVISLTVIAIALVGTLQVMAVTAGASADPMILQQAAAVADSHLEEILLNPYYDPDLGAGGGACPAPEASRALFDNVCDYDSLDDSGARDHTDTPLSELSAYRVCVTVDSTASLGSLSGPADVVRVDVRVTHTDISDITVSAYRTRF